MEHDNHNPVLWRHLVTLVRESDELPLAALRGVLSSRGDVPAIMAAHDTSHGPLLHEVCYHKHATLAAVQWLVQLCPAAVRHPAMAFGSRFPLQCACHNPFIKVEIVEYFIHLNPEFLNNSFDYFWPPLWCAINAGEDGPVRMDVVEMILNNNPKNICYRDRMLIISYALMKSWVTLELIMLFVEKYPEAARDCCHDAACTNMEILEYWVSLFPELITSTLRGQTIIHSVATRNHRPSNDVRARMDYLYNLYPDAIKMKDLDGNLPLHLACKKLCSLGEAAADASAIRYLLSVYPEAAGIQNNHGCLCLHLLYSAPQSQDAPAEMVLRLAGRLLGAYPGAVGIADREGRLPLHYACETRNHLQVISHLLVEKYPSSFHVSTENCSLQCRFGLCVEIGSLETNTRGHGVCLPLHCSSGGCPLDVFEFLLSERYACHLGGPTLHAICQDSDLRDKKTILQRLLEFGGVLNVRDDYGAAPLHAAVASDAGSDIIERLLDMDPEAVRLLDISNLLPLHDALRNKDPSSVADTLLDRYPEGVRVADSQGRFPIHFACQHGAPVELVQRMVEIDPDSVKMVDQRGDCPLYKACRAGDLELVQFLADQDTLSIQHANNDGMLPALMLCQTLAQKPSPLDELVVEVTTIFMLLQRHPEAILDYKTVNKLDLGSHIFSSRNK